MVELPAFVSLVFVDCESAGAVAWMRSRSRRTHFAIECCDIFCVVCCMLCDACCVVVVFVFVLYLFVFVFVFVL